MAPFDPDLGLWFAYLRRGDDVERFEGSRMVVRQWVKAQNVAQRWVFDVNRGAYLSWQLPPRPGAT